jgi:hypothetical protein
VKGAAGTRSVVTEWSVNRVQVRMPPRTVALSWVARQDLLARLIAGYPTTHRVVWQFRSVGTSRPVELLDPNDMMFVLAVIDAWALDVGEEALPDGIQELRSALRDART